MSQDATKRLLGRAVLAGLLGVGTLGAAQAQTPASGTPASGTPASGAPATQSPAPAPAPAPAASTQAGPAPSTRTATSPEAAQEAARIDQRITVLHSSLHITPSQEPQWSAFTTVMRENSDETTRSLETRRQNFAQMDAVTDLQSFADLTAQRSAEINRLVPPFRALYESFSAEQKQQADRLFRNYTERAARRQK